MLYAAYQPFRFPLMSGMTLTTSGWHALATMPRAAPYHLHET